MEGLGMSPYRALGHQHNWHKQKRLPFGNLRDPAGTRTQDPYIKSVLLYQLSYRI